MHTQPLMLNMSEDGVQCLAAVTPPPALSLAAEGDDDDKTQTGVLSPPAPSWTSFSSPSFTPFASSSSSAPSPTPPSLFCTAPSSFTAPSLLSSASSTCPSPPVFFTPCALPTSSSFSPPSSSSPPVPQLLLPPPPSPPSTSSSSFFPPSSPISSPPPIAPCSHPPPSSCPSTLPVSISPAPSSVSSLYLSSPPSLHPSPPSLLSFYSVFTPHFSSAPRPPLLYHHYSSLVSPPHPPSVSPAPAICSSLPSSSPPAPSSLFPPPVSPRPPCCSCSSLLPRLLSAHRLEVRRLLRGALASLGRRLDSLERRSKRRCRKKSSRQRGEKGGAARSPGLAAAPCSPVFLPPVPTSSSSSDSEDLHTLLLSSNLSQSEQKRRRRSRGVEEEESEGKQNKRIKKNHRKGETTDNKEEEDDAGRFVGRMMVSLGGGSAGVKEEVPLTLHNFIHRRHRTSQSEKGVSVVRQNGYRVPLLPHSSSSQHALHLLRSAQSCRTCSQSGQWHFSDLTPPLSSSFNHTPLSLWLCSSSSSSFISPASMLRLSAVAVETMTESVKAGACWSPLRPLKDWTAPSSLFSDHCYMRLPTPSFSARQQQKQRANHSSRNLLLPRRRPLPLLPPCSANGLCSPLNTGQSAVGTQSLSTNGERVKRVSQIRIRRASPRETPLTPMGLPKVKRLKKKEFSLEEIYTNKNYKSPSTNKSLETIFEEPREKDGALFLIGQQRRRRILHFPDFTQPRRRKRPQGTGLPVAIVPRKRAAARRHCHAGGSAVDDSDLDVMLVERLSALEDFLTQQGLDV